MLWPKTLTPDNRGPLFRWKIRYFVEKYVISEYDVRYFTTIGVCASQFSIFVVVNFNERSRWENVFFRCKRVLNVNNPATFSCINFLSFRPLTSCDGMTVVHERSRSSKYLVSLFKSPPSRGISDFEFFLTSIMSGTCYDWGPGALPRPPEARSEKNILI